MTTLSEIPLPVLVGGLSIPGPFGIRVTPQEASSWPPDLIEAKEKTHWITREPETPRVWPYWRNNQ